MEQQEAMAFIHLLCAYKQLWTKCRVVETVNRNPSANRDTVEDFVQEAANEGFEPVFQALESGQDVQDALRAALEAIPPNDH